MLKILRSAPVFLGSSRKSWQALAVSRCCHLITTRHFSSSPQDATTNRVDEGDERKNAKRRTTLRESAERKQSEKALKDKLNGLMSYYLEHDLPDSKLENELKALRTAIKDQGAKIKLLKSSNSADGNADQIKMAVSDLVSKKELFKSKIVDLLPKAGIGHSKQETADFENLIKSRFFYDQSFSIYQGVAGLYDLGPLGCLLQNNLIREWRKFFVLNDYMHEIDSAILTPEPVLRASGHLGKFADLMVKDEATDQPYRVDHLLKSALQSLIAKEADPSKQSELRSVLNKLESSQLTDMGEIDRLIKDKNIRAPETGNPLTSCEPFNLMFKTKIGSSASGMSSYLRPETAQGTFCNFKRLYEFASKRLPLVVAQVGKSFRNEINPRNGLIRQREFLMAEIEHFLDPAVKYSKYERFASVENLTVSLMTKEDQTNGAERPRKMTLRSAIDQKVIQSETLAYYIGRIHLFALANHIDETRMRFREHLSTEMAHYANECWDFECELAMGWIECAGIADRCDFDVKQHSSHSSVQLTAERKNSDNSGVEHIFPHVIEPSFGIGRIMTVILEHNFRKRAQDSTRFYFNLPVRIAPYKCCLLPMNLNDPAYSSFVEKIASLLLNNDICHRVEASSGSIGRRYWRVDEMGVPLCITVDSQTLADNKTVTIREINEMSQIRVDYNEIPSIIRALETKQSSWKDMIVKYGKFAKSSTN